MKSYFCYKKTFKRRKKEEEPQHVDVLKKVWRKKEMGGQCIIKTEAGRIFEQ